MEKRNIFNYTFPSKGKIQLKIIIFPKEWPIK